MVRAGRSRKRVASQSPYIDIRYQSDRGRPYGVKTRFPATLTDSVKAELKLNYATNASPVSARVRRMESLMVGMSSMDSPNNGSSSSTDAADHTGDVFSVLGGSNPGTNRPLDSLAKAQRAAQRMSELIERLARVYAEGTRSCACIWGRPVEVYCIGFLREALPHASEVSSID